MFKTIHFFVVVVLFNGASLGQEVIGNLGDTYSNESLSLSFTLGEVFIGDLSNNNAFVSQGFHQTYTPEAPAVLSSHVKDANILVYPNPTAEILKIDSKDQKLDSYAFYDLQGKLILQAKIIQSHVTIDLSGVSDGVYRLILNNSNNQTISYLIIKIR